MELNTNIFKNACAFTLLTRKWSNSRQADKDKITTDADKTLLKVTKTLIECAEYDTIGKFMTETRRFVTRRSVPTFFLKGAYLVKLEVVQMIADYITSRRDTLKEKLIPALVAAYPPAKDLMLTRLNGQFDEDDYPSIEVLPSLFDITYNFISFEVPEGLPPGLAKLEKEKLAEQWKETGEKVTVALRATLAEALEHMSDRLKVVPGEKPKIFKNSSFERITEFIDTFKCVDIMNDVELGKLVEKARQVVRGVDPDKLRKDTDMRNSLAARMTEIKTGVDGLLSSTPSRAFALEDE